MYVAHSALHASQNYGTLGLTTAACVTLLAIKLGAAATLLCPLPTPLPLFSSDDWWNVDVSTASLDPSSSAFITFIDNGST